jgi:hypothetical protein
VFRHSQQPVGVVAAGGEDSPIASRDRRQAEANVFERLGHAVGVEVAETGRCAYGKHTDYGFVQPRALYREVMTGTRKEHLVTSIVSHGRAGVKPEVMPG